MTMHSFDGPLRPIRSFVKREGRISNAQRRALNELGPSFLLPYTAAHLHWPTTFGRVAPRVLEIGFGMGTATAEIAAQHPHQDFLGVEVHTPGVGALLKLIGEHSLQNIRIIQQDAVDVMQWMIEDASLDRIHIFFPDPWPKARHHKRRLVQPPLTALLASRLKPGGYLHCATDWQSYAEQMLQVLSAEPLLCNTMHGYTPRPSWRPSTKFEIRGLQQSHCVWDLLFQRHGRYGPVNKGIERL